MGGFTAKQQKEMKAERTAIKSLGTKEEKYAALRKNPGLLPVPHPDPTKRPPRKKVGDKYVRSKWIATGHPSDPYPLKEDERYETRPEVLLRARRTYEKNTGRKARPVKSALLYKDFTDYEKEELQMIAEVDD